MFLVAAKAIEDPLPLRLVYIARDSFYRHMKRFGIESENRTVAQDD